VSIEFFKKIKNLSAWIKRGREGEGRVIKFRKN
jgi:hypothetical protein